MNGSGSQKNIIQIRGLEYSYPPQDDRPAVPALSGVDLDVAEGSFVAVVGRNGCGKSTLAKCMNALLLPDSGSVVCAGFDTSCGETVWELRRNVGMVFQNPDNQLVSSVVEDDVAFGPENLGEDPSEIRRRVDGALKAVGMYELRRQAPHLLSGGQKQRVAIAGVLALDPKCVVLDEPTAMLDPSGRREVMDIIETLRARGTTVILITHFMEEAARADRVVVMDGGRIAFEGSPAEVFAQTGRLEECGLSVPFAAELAQLLREEGIDVPGGIVNAQQLQDHLCSLK